jgi:hypothetical protein
MKGRKQLIFGDDGQPLGNVTKRPKAFLDEKVLANAKQGDRGPMLRF